MLDFLAANRRRRAAGNGGGGGGGAGGGGFADGAGIDKLYVMNEWVTAQYDSLNTNFVQAGAAIGTPTVSAAVQVDGLDTLQLDQADGVTLTGTQATLSLSGTDDFTWEAFVNVDDNLTNHTVFSKRDSSGSEEGRMIVVAPTNILRMTVWPPTGIVSVDSTSTLTPGTTYHVAVSRYNMELYLFIDGVLEAGPTAIERSTSNNQPLEMGINRFNSSRSMSGYLGPARVTYGAARYTEAFTVPTAPFDITEAVPTFANYFNFRVGSATINAGASNVDVGDDITDVVTLDGAVTMSQGTILDRPVQQKLGMSFDNVNGSSPQYIALTDAGYLAPLNSGTGTVRWKGTVQDLDDDYIWGVADASTAATDIGIQILSTGVVRALYEGTTSIDGPVISIDTVFEVHMEITDTTFSLTVDGTSYGTETLVTKHAALDVLHLGASARLGNASGHSNSTAYEFEIL